MSGPFDVADPDDLHALLEFSRLADRHVELDRVARLIVDTAVQYYDAHAVCLALAPLPSGRPRRDWLTPAFPDPIRGELDEGVARCFELGEPGSTRLAEDHALLVVSPVCVSDRRLGVLAVVSRTDLEPLALQARVYGFAAHVGNALVRALQFEAFRDISHATARSAKVQHSLELAFRELAALGFELATISAVDPFRNAIQTIRGMNVPPEWSRRAHHSLASGDIQAWVIETRRPEIVKGPHPLLDQDIYTRFDHASLARVFVPVVLGDEVVGTIEAGCPIGRGDAVITPETVAEVETIARKHAAEVAQARPHALLHLIAGHAVDVLGAESASLHVYRNGSEVLAAGAGRATPEFLRQYPPRADGIGSEARRTGEPQIRTAAMLAESRPDLYESGIRSLAAVPLLGEGSNGSDGVLYVHFWHAHDFTDADVQILSMVARHLEVAIENAEITRAALETTERAWTFSRLQRVIQEVAAGVQLDTVLGTIAQTVLTAFGADNVTLYQYFEDEDRFEFPPVMKGTFREPQAMAKTVRTDDIVSRTVRDGASRFITHCVAAPVPSSVRVDGDTRARFVVREGIMSAAALVLSSGTEKLGAMFVNYRTTHEFSDAEKDAMQALASSASLAITSVRRRKSINADAGRRLIALGAMQAVLERVALAKGDVEQQIMDLVVEKALEIVGAGREAAETRAGRVAVFLRYRHALGTLESQATRGLPAGSPPILQDVTEGIVGLAARTRESVLVPDVSDQRWAATYRCVVPGMRSELAVPVVGDAGLFGVLNLEDPEPRRFTEEDRGLLEALADQAASALHTVQLYATLERQMQPLHFLSQIATRLHGDLETRCRLLLTGITAKQGLAFSRAMLFLLDEHHPRINGTMAIGAVSGAEAQLVWSSVEQFEKDAAGPAAVPQLLLDEAERVVDAIRSGRASDSALGKRVRSTTLLRDAAGAVAECVRERRTVIVDAQAPDPLRAALDEVEAQRAFACIPVSIDDRALGALVVDNAFFESEAELDREAVRNVDAFAEILAFTITHARLEGLKQWRTFMRGAGHLFGSHIAVIGALVRKLRATLSDEHFKELDAGVAQMQRLLADFHGLTEAAEMDLIDLRDLVKATVGALRASVDVPIELTLPRRTLNVHGNRRMLDSVLTELIENADEAMTLSKSPTRMITVRVGEDAALGPVPMAHIEITDTGPGVAPEHLTTIFRALFTTKERGSGLGLMRVWDVVERHEGSVTATNAPGAGARFVVHLPLAQP